MGATQEHERRVRERMKTVATVTPHRRKGAMSAREKAGTERAKMISPQMEEQVRKLLETPPGLLGTIDKQRAFLAHTYARPSPCPYCNKLVSYFEAAQSDFDLGREAPSELRCPHCETKLVKFVPLFAFQGGAYHWRRLVETPNVE